MKRVMTATWRVAAIVAVFAACTEPLQERSRPLPPPPSEGLEVRLTSAVAAPQRGDTVVLTLRVRASTGKSPLGSYLARLTYDTTRLGWIGEEAAASGDALHMVNGETAGEVRAAGAAATGFTSASLLRFRFLARTNDAFAGLALHMEDVRATDGSAITGVRVMPGVTASEGTT